MVKRNINEIKQVFETDWLASKPVFYNEKNKKVSHNINDVIDLENLEFHPEGFNNYLDFGYCVLEQTPIKNVKFLRHSSRLTIDNNDCFKIEYLSDPVDQWLDKTSNENEVLELISLAVKKWEHSVEGEIIIPTSGGYDSRLLNFFIEDKSRIRSFTYGISNNQAKSFEVVYAKKLSEILGVKWEHILLGEYHNYFDEWDDIFGISTHAHGMYHIEFYSKILSKVQQNHPLLSGIIGDAWAGSISLNSISSSLDVLNLGYTHGMKADSKASLLKSDKDIIENYYLTHSEKLESHLFRIVEAMRFKIILLSYLIRIPNLLGFKSWSPFLIEEIALAMLTLPPERRNNRNWQKDFFQKNNLFLESLKLKKNYQNNLNIQAISNIKLKPLNINLLKEFFQVSYIEWINNCLTQSSWNWAERIQGIPLIGNKIMNRLNIDSNTLTAYCAYLTIKPIENILLKRDIAVKNQSI